MSKERLEEVIELMCDSYYDYLVADNIKKSEVRYKSYLDYKEIIKNEFEKQAERVQELEKEIEDWRKEVKKWQRFLGKNHNLPWTSREGLVTSIIARGGGCMKQEIDLNENAVYRVIDGKLEKVDKPGDGFGKQTITWQNGKPTHYEISYTKK